MCTRTRLLRDRPAAHLDAHLGSALRVLELHKCSTVNTDFFQNKRRSASALPAPRGHGCRLRSEGPS